MKMLFLLHMLLCQWVVSLCNENGNVGIENVRDAYGEVFFAFACDELPLSFESVRSPVNHTDIEFVRLSSFNKTDLKVSMSFGNYSDFSIKALCDNKRSIYSVLPVTGKPLIKKIYFRRRHCLSKAGHGHHDESKCEKQSFHAANIEKI